MMTFLFSYVDPSTVVLIKFRSLYTSDKSCDQAGASRNQLRADRPHLAQRTWKCAATSVSLLSLLKNFMSVLSLSWNSLSCLGCAADTSRSFLALPLCGASSPSDSSSCSSSVRALLLPEDDAATSSGSESSENVRLDARPPEPPASPDCRAGNA
jgi:hypothetical protein